MGISWRVLHLAALVGSAVFSRDGSASRKAKDLSRVLHFSLRSIIRPSCRALQKHSALPFRRKCHVLRSCHFSGMTPLRVPAKQDHYHPSRQRPRKGQQGGSGDRASFAKWQATIAPFAPLSKLASGALPPWIPWQGVSPLHPEHTEMLNIWRKVHRTFRQVFRNFC